MTSSLGGGVVKAGASAEAAELHECYSKLVQLQEQLEEHQQNDKNIAEKERDKDELLSLASRSLLNGGVHGALAESLATTVCAPTNRNCRNARVWLSPSSSSVGSIYFKGSPSTSSASTSITLSPLDDSAQCLLPCMEKQINRLNNDIDRLKRRNSELPDLAVEICNAKSRLEVLQEVVNDQVNAKLREDKDNQSFNKVDRAAVTTSTVDVSTVDLVQETADKKKHKSKFICTSCISLFIYIILFYPCLMPNHVSFPTFISHQDSSTCSLFVWIRSRSVGCVKVHETELLPF